MLPRPAHDRTHVTGGTYDDLAETDVSVGDVVTAISAAGVTGPSASTANAALSAIGHDTDAAHLNIPAGELFDLGPYGGLLATGLLAYEGQAILGVG